MTKKPMIWVTLIVAAFLAAELSAAVQGSSTTGSNTPQTESVPQIVEIDRPSSAETDSKGSWAISEETNDSDNKSIVQDTSVELDTYSNQEINAKVAANLAGAAAIEAAAEAAAPLEEVTKEPQAVLATQEFPIETDASRSGDEPVVEESGGQQSAAQNSQPSDEAIALEAQQLSASLEQQFKALRKSLETEDAFSLQLAENYFGYGKLLKQSGELEAAADAFVDALHIQKINHGLYASEQRPVLKELFETHYALGNIEEFEDYLERILWVETHNPEIIDDFSFQILVSVGNQYLDDFLTNPTAGSRNVENLLRAKNHLRAAIKRHDNKPLSVLFLPYGELALIGFLESRIYSDVDKTSSTVNPRIKSMRNLDGRELALFSYLDDSFPRGEAYLRGYLKKASEENNADHVVGALTALGDYHQLFKKTNSAIQLYKLAWDAAKALPEDSARITALKTPTALPAFEYAQNRVPIIPKRPSVLVPVKLTVDGRGKVVKVAEFAPDSEYAKHSSRARRAARHLIFRPTLEDGETSPDRQIDYKIRIYTRKKAGAAET